MGDGSALVAGFSSGKSCTSIPSKAVRVGLRFTRSGEREMFVLKLFWLSSDDVFLDGIFTKLVRSPFEECFECTVLLLKFSNSLMSGIFPLMRELNWCVDANLDEVPMLLKFTPRGEETLKPIENPMGLVQVKEVNM